MCLVLCLSSNPCACSGFEKVGGDRRRSEKVREGSRRLEEKVGEGWIKFEKVRESSRRLEKVREGWRRLEKVGEGSRRSEKVREGWTRRLEEVRFYYLLRRCYYLLLRVTNCSHVCYYLFMTCFLVFTSC